MCWTCAVRYHKDHFDKVKEVTHNELKKHATLLYYYLNRIEEQLKNDKVFVIKYSNTEKTLTSEEALKGFKSVEEFIMKNLTDSQEIDRIKMLFSIKPQSQEEIDEELKV